MSQEDKPCNKCPIEKRDDCWVGTAFACQDWYDWIHIYNTSKQSKTVEVEE